MRYYLVMHWRHNTLCTHCGERAWEPVCLNCGECDGIADEGEYVPHCTSGKVVSTYDTLGKARSQRSRYKGIEGTHPAYIVYFDTIDLMRADEVEGSEHEQAERKSVTWAERAIGKK